MKWALMLWINDLQMVYKIKPDSYSNSIMSKNMRRV